MNQDDFYLKKEANDFFDRWQKLNYSYDGSLRENKKDILEILKSNMQVNEKTVLEVGCFISDLLSELRDRYQCNVYGVETSSKACQFAKDKFSLEIENSSFSKSTFFNLDSTNRNMFDLIIFEDVLSWMSRDNILQVISVTDWLLKDGGIIFIRDFSPFFGFAFENHHQAGNEIYNFKQPGGHKSFFLMSGKYFEKYNKTYITSKFQKIETQRHDSNTWSDSVLEKIDKPLHPLISF